MAKVLVVDDDASIREMVAMALEAKGYAVIRAASAGQAKQVLRSESPDLVICDIYMPGEDGLSVLATAREVPDPPPVILMTARGSLETAAEAAATGAFDYVAKPFDLAVLVGRARTALGSRRNGPTRDDEEGPARLIIGSHPAIVAVYTAVARVARLSVPVVILGETGTGKELVARALHRFGARPQGPFIPVHCGAIPDSLLESELFGHRRGAFTDASRDRRGALSLADGGTLFLDEIGEVSPAFQVRLLRFLEDGVVTPLGAEKSEEVDVRVVAATHRDLEAMVKDGRFRQDLYYRLAGYEIRIPPLRERLSDLPALVAHLQRRAEDDLNLGPTAPPTEAVLARLSAYPWPGNVRQLAHILRRALIDAHGLADLAAVNTLLGGTGPPADGNLADFGTTGLVRLASPPLPLAVAEHLYVLAILESVGGNKSEAARLLEVDRKTLIRKLRYGTSVSPQDEED